MFQKKLSSSMKGLTTKTLTSEELETLYEIRMFLLFNEAPVGLVVALDDILADHQEGGLPWVTPTNTCKH